MDLLSGAGVKLAEEDENRAAPNSGHSAHKTISNKLILSDMMPTEPQSPGPDLVQDPQTDLSERCPRESER